MRNNFTISGMDTHHFDGLVAFLRVAEAGSFRQAADELGVSPSALSQTIRTLEARVGVPLLARTTRRVGLTEAGARLLQGVRPAVQAVSDGLEAARELSGAATGRLRLTMPQAVAALLAPALAREFCTAHPGLQVELHGDDAPVDIVAQGFDAGLRLGELVAQDMVAVRLTPPFAFAVVASPDYLACRGLPAKPEDLAAHDCIRMLRPGGQGTLRWDFTGRSGPYAVVVSGPLVVNQTALAVEAALAGAGLAYVARPLVAQAIGQGRLQPVLARHMPRTSGVFLYYPSRLQSLPKLRAFVDYARGRFALPQEAP